MNLLRVDVNLKYLTSVFLLVILSLNAAAWDTEYVQHNAFGENANRRYSVLTLEASHKRERRATPAEPSTSTETANATTSTSGGVNVTITHVITNATDSASSPSPMPTVAVTQIPLLGTNGSGILKVNLTENLPKVSDPIVPDDNFTDFFKETPERIKSEQNLTQLTYDNHNFYNSTFIGNVTYFNEYWTEINKLKPEIHAILSNSHRRATSVQLKFAFPFYGKYIRNITVATGGFIYTGEHVHNWLAATQYIAPLMANFDTSLTNDSYVKLVDDGERFTAFWENVNLQDDVNKTFTFAVTLYKNGDIVFAYKQIPIDIQQINDTLHPVKVGISDAYLNENIIFYVRRKMIYEYHRVSFRNYVIANNTILRLNALPTCIQYDTCKSCLTHETSFNCTWCPQIQKCSSGTDRNKQDWKLRNCDKTMVQDVDSCDAGSNEGGVSPGNKTIYSTDTPQPPNHNTTVDIIPEQPPKTVEDVSVTKEKGVEVANRAAAAAAPRRSAVSGIVVALLTITLVCGVVAWGYYAFKNPHTRSGQLLIKYRPSQWSWRRGEARYTAATIHM